MQYESRPVHPTETVSEGIDSGFSCDWAFLSDFFAHFRRLDEFCLSTDRRPKFLGNGSDNAKRQSRIEKLFRSCRIIHHPVFYSSRRRAAVRSRNFIRPPDFGSRKFRRLSARLRQNN